MAWYRNCPKADYHRVWQRLPPPEKIMWVKQCHKPPIWEWLIPPISGDLGDDLWHCFNPIPIQSPFNHHEKSSPPSGKSPLNPWFSTMKSPCSHPSNAILPQNPSKSHQILH
jgi:hypothetical protein